MVTCHIAFDYADRAQYPLPASTCTMQPAKMQHRVQTRESAPPENNSPQHLYKKLNYEQPTLQFTPRQSAGEERSRDH
jgi:hypothetical protein